MSVVSNLYETCICGVYLDILGVALSVEFVTGDLHTPTHTHTHTHTDTSAKIQHPIGF